jgi:hypothetical protein
VASVFFKVRGLRCEEPAQVEMLFPALHYEQYRYNCGVEPIFTDTVPVKDKENAVSQDVV